MTDWQIKILWGRIELKQHYRQENGVINCYGENIEYDQDGNETGRSESFLSSMGWDDGSPMIEKDYNFFQKLFP